MLQSDFEKFAASNSIGSVVFFAVDDVWQVFAYGYADHDVLAGFTNLLQVVKGKSAKTYTSLDRAYAAIRTMGYRGQIVIDS
jgi:hypothetical protein